MTSGGIWIEICDGIGGGKGNITYYSADGFEELFQKALTEKEE